MKLKPVITVIGAAAAVSIAWIAFCGYQWSWGPFGDLHDVKTRSLPGNTPEYELNTQPRREDNALTGKRIIFLGSSVTYGAASQGVSFVDYLAVRNGCESIKEAVSGTTLMDNGSDSYVSRLKRLHVDGKVDLFVCQLSTNDVSRKKPLGTVSESFSMEDFDTRTTAGAIEYIIAYVKETYGCPVVFYTSPRFDREAYGNLVDVLEEIREKWNIEVIDMWNDESFNAISDDERQLYLADPVHPTKAGYLVWWIPLFEQRLVQIIAG